MSLKYIVSVYYITGFFRGCLIFAVGIQSTQKTQAQFSSFFFKENNNPQLQFFWKKLHNREKKATAEKIRYTVT